MADPVKRDRVEESAAYTTIGGFAVLVILAGILEYQDRTMHDNGLLMMIVGFIIAEMKGLVVSRSNGENGGGSKIERR